MKIIPAIAIVAVFVFGLWMLGSFLVCVLQESIHEGEAQQDEPLEHSVPPFDEGGMYIG